MAATSLFGGTRFVARAAAVEPDFGSFGGRFYVFKDGNSLADLDGGDSELFVPSLSGDKLGFLRVAAVPNGGFAYVIWEEGLGVLAANDNAKDNFDLVFATLDLNGQIGN